MGDRTRQTYERNRLETKGVFKNVWVVCKCPFCGKEHKEMMAKQPLVMPRRYCPLHSRLREES